MSEIGNPAPERGFSRWLLTNAWWIWTVYSAVLLAVAAEFGWNQTALVWAILLPAGAAFSHVAFAIARSLRILVTSVWSSVAELRRSIIVTLGFLCRWMFFVAAGIAVYVYCFDGSQRAFDTPFAALTVNELIGAISERIVGVALYLILWAWAFRSGEKNYLGWIVFGGLVGCIGLVLVNS